MRFLRWSTALLVVVCRTAVGANRRLQRLAFPQILGNWSACIRALRRLPALRIASLHRPVSPAIALRTIKRVQVPMRGLVCRSPKRTRAKSWLASLLGISSGGVTPIASRTVTVGIPRVAESASRWRLRMGAGRTRVCLRGILIGIRHRVALSTPGVLLHRATVAEHPVLNPGGLRRLTMASRLPRQRMGRQHLRLVRPVRLLVQ